MVCMWLGKCHEIIGMGVRKGTVVVAFWVFI